MRRGKESEGSCGWVNILSLFWAFQRNHTNMPPTFGEFTTYFAARTLGFDPGPNDHIHPSKVLNQKHVL